MDSRDSGGGRRPRIAYSGVEGAFAQIAAGKIFPEGELVPCASFQEAYLAVDAGDCDHAVLPIENSYAGEVGQVMDLLFRGDLFLCAVYELEIVQNLIGTKDADLEDVKTVMSHPQALGQCGNYLRRRGFERMPASNTARAAQEVALRQDKTLAAIASAETAKLYDLKILERNINEEERNTTRFGVFSRTAPQQIPENGSILLLFTVRHEAGSLARALTVIGNHGFNMKTLHSRPMKTLAWRYYFIVEAEGDLRSENGRSLLGELSENCSMLKVAGRYPADETLSAD